MEFNLLEVRGVSKAFAATQALKNMNVTFLPGKVHVLIGENGAGKSTLLKIISGFYRADEGGILLGGTECRFHSPQDARAASIGMVYQELTLLPEMTVMDNLFLGTERLGLAHMLNKKEMRRIFAEKNREYGLKLPPDALVGSLSLSQQQLVEVLKVLIEDPAVYIFDEATSALDNTEVQTLFSIISRLREKGKTILFISHRMEEIFAIGDVATVLKDGEKVITTELGSINQDQLIEHMVGRAISDVFPAKCESPGQVLLEVSHMHRRFGDLKDICIQARTGEIIGIAGLQGQGQSTLLNCMAGVERYDSGEMHLSGERIPQKGPRQAIRRGIVLVPEDRKTQALFLEHTVHTNLSISSQYLRQEGGFLKNRLDKEFAETSIQGLSIKTQSRQSLVASLSGGNQQKVVLGRVLGTKPKVILFNEPTRGVDIQTKQEFYIRMRALADSGICIILYSSDLLEVIGISDKVYTMYEGAITGELRGEEINEIQIMRGAVDIKEAGA